MPISEIIVGCLTFAAAVLTQGLRHRRWEVRQAEARRQAIEKARKERHDEMAVMQQEIHDENTRLFENALRIGEVHRQEADSERGLRVAADRAHTECRQEVARLAGQLDELRVRLSEDERTHSHYEKRIEDHRHVKHQAITGLTISEGIMSLIQELAPLCTDGTLDPIMSLIEKWQPRLPEVEAENRKIAGEL